MDFVIGELYNTFHPITSQSLEAAQWTNERHCTMAISLSILRIIFSRVLCLFLLSRSYMARWLNNLSFLQTQLDSHSHKVIHFNKSTPVALLGSKRKYLEIERDLLLKWKMNCSHMRTRGDTCGSHERWSYLHKNDITYMT